MAKIRLNR